jgi:hypothetical protein
MKRLILCGLLATGLAQTALALRDLNLKQQGELPRDQYLDLVDPGHFYLDKLVVKFVEDTRVRLRGERLVSLEGRDLSAVESFLKAHPDIKVARLIDTMQEDELDAYVARGERLSGCDVADMNNYYLFSVTERNADPKGLLADLLKLDLVQTGYYEPIGEPAACNGDPLPATPDYESDQDYRDPAPTGIDIDYAWTFSPSYGKGRNIDRFQDLEWGWCESHEDFDLVIRNGPDSAADSVFNHGTAVVSIVGACDDGKGVTGLTPNVFMTARVVSNHTSWAAALTAIGNDLVTGEVYLIEMHAPGPDPGTSCPCNCGQFRYIAIEYWQANFDAILANSANGRYCVEAAGNGSMNLDWYGYNGAFDPWVRDSQAILVGAGTSGAVHNPECFTNYGARISAYGWGDNVYAAGYGNEFDQSGCEQDYTWSFSGTSSASPIVAGAAISLSTIDVGMYGSYLSPTNLRERLQLNGTHQGDVNTWKEINVQPNMKGILAPDLTPYNPGWQRSILPTDVAGTSTLPGALWPAPANTYFDFAWINWSHYATVPFSQAYLYQDEVVLFAASAMNHGPYTYVQVQDWPAQIRGGRHYFMLYCDPLDNVNESGGNNNWMIEDYCWKPVPLGSDTPEYFSRGPKRSPYGAGANAMDGYGNGGGFPGWWDVAGVAGAMGADYDIHLYNTDPTPESGWEVPLRSSVGSSIVDFVGSNNNVASDADFYGVVNYNDSDNGYIVERQGSAYLGSPQFPPVNAGNYDLTWGELLDVYEINCTAGQPVWFNVDVTSGSADVVLLVFGPNKTYFARANSTWDLNNGGPGAGESGIFTPALSGYHCVVICKHLISDLASSASYSLIWGLPIGDLVHNTPPGWTAPIVPRNWNEWHTPGQLPAVLNEGYCVADIGYANIGAAAITAGTNLALHLDGPFVDASPDLPALAAGAQTSLTEYVTGLMKGGRHELGSVLDFLGEAPEQYPSGELNNRFFTQYVWPPHPLTREVPEVRAAAPNFINSDNPDCWAQPGYNQDGYLFTTWDWAGVAAMARNSDTALMMEGYDHASTDPLTALLGPVTFDFAAPGRLVMVLANGVVLGNDVGLNAGVMNVYGYPAVPPTGDYVVQSAGIQSVLGLGTAQTATLAGDNETGGQLVHIYEIYLYADAIVPVHLFNDSAVDLGLAVFTAGQDYVSMDGALLNLDIAPAGQDEDGSFVAPVTGYYGVVVYRSGSADLGPDAPYALLLGSPVPAAVANLSIAMVETDPGDGLYHVDLQWDDVTTDIHGNPLVVDHYNVYWSESPSGIWNLFAVTPTSEALNQAAPVGGPTGTYFRVTAVGANGVLLGGSRPSGTAVRCP